MAKLIPSPKFHVEKSDGTPASGWKVNTYEPGTSTRKSTYTTSAESTANANPVVLDSRGEADIWWSGSYKVVVTDENDVVIYTVDNYSAGDSSSTADNYNLVENGSFEIESTTAETPEGWTVTDYSGGTHVLDNAANSHGLVSLKFTSTGTGGGYASTDFIAVEELIRYGIFFSIKSSVADVRNVVEVIWYTDAQAVVSTSTPYDESAANPTSWTRYKYYVSAPSTARYVKVKIYGCHSSDATTGSTWFDDVVFFADESSISYDTTAGTQPSYTLSPAKPIAAYVTGQKFTVKFHSTGTTGSNTLNILSLGAKNLKQYDNAGNKAPAIIYSDMVSDVAYDGTDMVVLDAIKYTAAPARQTVLSSDLSSGVASFISAGSGLACNLSATVPVIMAHAYGFNTTGAVDYISSISSASTGYWSGLTASNTNYLYIDRNTSTGALTAGATLHPPQYGYTYDQTKCALLNFEGSDASTSMIDAYGNTWTASGNAQIDTAQFKFGASSLLLDGTGDYISSSSFTSISQEDGFTIHCQVRWSSLPTAGNTQNIAILTSPSFDSLQLQLNNTAGTIKLLTSLSSNGSSWDIASSGAGTKTSWSTGVWYHIAITYDGATYRVYVDGVQDYSVASTSKIAKFATVRIGSNFDGSGNYLNGWVDAFEILPYPLFTTSTSFTPPAAARTVEGNFFSIPEMKMYTIDSASVSAGTNPGMTAVQRLFVGEAVTGAATVSSVVNYALRGQYVGAWTNTLPGTSTSVSQSHNIGTTPLLSKLSIKNISTDNGYTPGYIVNNPAGVSASYAMNNNVSVTGKLIGFSTASSASFQIEPKGGGADVALTVAKWAYRLEANRGW